MASAPASAERSLSTCPVPPEALAVAAFIRSAPVFALITLSRFGRGRAGCRLSSASSGSSTTSTW